MQITACESFAKAEIIHKMQYPYIKKNSTLLMICGRLIRATNNKPSHRKGAMPKVKSLLAQEKNKNFKSSMIL